MGILDRVKKGSLDAPQRILLYGVEGVGKSTWAASAPSPVFICAEDGLGPALAEVDRIAVGKYADVLDTVSELRRARHGYQTLVLDTADWMEALLYTHICERDGKNGVEDYGYGKGYIAAQQELRLLLAQLDLLRRERGMGIIILAHAQIKAFSNPAGDNFDRYIMKGHEKLTGLLKEWSDVVLFARYEVFVTKDSKKATKGKAIMSDARIVHTMWTPAWDAKNRLNLPETLPLNYDAFADAARVGLAAQNGHPTLEQQELAARVAELFAGAVWPSDELRAKVLSRLGGSLDAGDLARLPVSKLRPAEDYLRAQQPVREENAPAEPAA